MGWICLQEMRTAAMLAKAVSGDAGALDAWQALESGNTERGLKHSAWTVKWGSLEIGKQADIIAIDLSALEQTAGIPSHLTACLYRLWSPG